MDAAFTAEQDEIRRALRELLAEHGGSDDVRSAVRTADGYDAALWRQLAQDLGLPGLALPEEYGGVGRGLADLAVACEETGHALLPSPLIATAALAAPLIVALGTGAQRAALLPRIAAGELTATPVVPGGSLGTALGLTGDPTGGAWAGGGRAGGVQARPVGGGAGWRLYGEADQVLDGHSAGLLLVAAHAGGFPRSRTLLFLVRPDTAAGVVRTRRTSLDETRPLARVELRDTEAELLGADDTADVTGALAAVGQGAAAVLAAEVVGTAAGALERAVAHVGAREQFGRAVGSFQAVKHRLADLYVRVQAARSAAYYAAWDPATAGGLALAQALEALRITTAEAVQLHGGNGFTWEHEAHLYFKRAAADELLFGPVHRLRDHAAQRAGLFAALEPAAPKPVTPGSAGQVAV
ncbi:MULTISPECIES: acyl-CoA dehydrogenase family protein [unclassified Streptomyces]|uniref:acyl-CoA dehydrogenase family protein n=1 Tax=unclassified Streptomyces TaxID=2593676 RepID=UPI00224D9BBF|nr:MULTISPECIES: acyl-CoA dehydrogenase family protein [unclassified Streptomyces]MCX4795716.1 acyl-CoA/acyl-ACP dehydrogenase [Streptomyces sp. NBC_01242]WSJ37005.1 acyl-CoA/acyl-ACP dehydrogenase [Streptomyces sp. NBC_01321]WSP56768.1 acyl-CoA/acyl-ACP dehydrogenase [Streptomyces sp. NBC_01241]WSP63404.1 acyl-CoA/acyl-ACP dehydrogenase [Streptomyces sp. NBC_01240]